MKIEKIEVINISLPMKKILRTSFGEINCRETLIIKLYSGDLVGYGESSLLTVPISEPETISGGLKLLKETICPKLLSRAFKSVKHLYNVLQKYKDNPVTIIGIEGAFYHLLSQKKKVYLGKIFGSRKKVLNAGETLGMNKNTQSTFDEIDKFIKMGYKDLKLKIMPGNDIKIIKSIRSKYKNIGLSVDANASYQIKNIKLLERLDQFNLTMIEQPFEADELETHALLQKRIKTPVCLDESIKSIDDLKSVIKLKSCEIVNIKPARIGSYYESILIHDLCNKHNIKVFVGGRLESGIGKAINLALAGLKNFALPVDMSSSLEYFDDDIIEPLFKTTDGKIKLPTSIGIGFKIKKEKIKKYTVHSVVISNDNKN